jgi:hypothetical protein
MKKLMIILMISIFGSTTANAGDSYIFGGAKLFFYDVEQSDVDQTAQELVNLGFSTAKVSANSNGVGLEVGIGFPLSDALDVEASYVYMGEFELKADMTGPTESLTATSSPWSLPVVAKLKIGESDANVFVKGGWHFWNQESTISASKGTVELYGKGNDPTYGFGANLGGLIVSYDVYNFSGVGAGMGVGEGGISSFGVSWSTKF